jgi:putative transposase
MVSKNATVSMHGNTYEVDPMLARRGVELVFDPFDLTDIDVRKEGHSMGKATPFLIGRHAHRKTRTGDQASVPPTATGIDYLRLLDEAHGRQLAGQINYAALLQPDQGGEPAGPATGDEQQEQR